MQPRNCRTQSAPDPRGTPSRSLSPTTPTTPEVVVFHEEKAKSAAFQPAPVVQKGKKLDDDFDFDFDELEKELKVGTSKPAPAPVAPTPAPTPAPKPAPAPVPANSADFLESEVNVLENKVRMQQLSGAQAISSSDFFGKDDPTTVGDSQWDSGLLKDRLSSGLATGKALVGLGFNKLQEYRGR